MSTVLGVALLTAPTPSVAEKLASLGVVLGDAVDASRGLFIRWDGWDSTVPDSLASSISEATGATCFSVTAQTSADAYQLGEYEQGRLVRQLTFSRDAGGWSPPTGVERPWEADLHFALPLDEFLDRLGDNDEWSEEDLEAARAAHESRRIDQLPRLPDACASSVFAFLKHRGVDIDAPMAKYRKPSFLGKLFGR